MKSSSEVETVGELAYLGVWLVQVEPECDSHGKMLMGLA